MKDLFTIGEMSKLFDTNIRTLRYYDEIGILKPEKVNPQNNYRYYSTVQFERMNTIRYLRALDMPLENIERFLESRDTDILLKMLEQQHQETMQKMQDLKRIQKKIENRMGQIADAVHSEVDVIVEKQISSRRIVTLKREIPLDDNLEVPIRQLERENNLESAIFLGKVGVSVAREDLEQHSFQKFSGIFVILEEGDQYQGKTSKLQEGDYLCIRFTGTHRHSNQYYEKLLAYLEERGYRLNGDSVEVTLIDSGITSDENKFLTELQLPIIKK